MLADPTDEQLSAVLRADAASTKRGLVALVPYGVFMDRAGVITGSAFHDRVLQWLSALRPLPAEALLTLWFWWPGRAAGGLVATCSACPSWNVAVEPLAAGYGKSPRAWLQRARLEPPGVAGCTHDGAVQARPGFGPERYDW